ncbi:hypothetical protein [Serratia sp. DD3]|uniref:hypothetical protein n=1 Tax=Serratia sp. DD3 TaxID=1410619 RepID=UPI0004D56DFA|nr:hypothetical protein [Serratia sp. DD3]KEY60823.1 hypothetical protein SRDD_02020 [Serratia sp. DD3]
MINGSVIFFYTFASLMLIYCVFQFRRSNNKWLDALKVISFIIAILASTFYFEPLSGFWIISLLVGSYLIRLVVFVIYCVVKDWCIRINLSRMIKGVRSSGFAYMDEKFLKKAKKSWLDNCWFIAYSPENNMFEIGVKLFDAKMEINEKFFIRTLSGRVVFMIPERFLESLNLAENIICPLADFYDFSAEAKELVFNYAEAIKNNSAEPWNILSTGS